MRPLLFLFTLICCLSLASCGFGDGTLREYLNSDSTIWSKVPVHAETGGYAEVTIRTDFGYPEIVVLYGCEEYNLKRLHKFDCELIVDGQVIPSDADNVNAFYVNSSVDFPVASCCDSITEKLQIDSSIYLESYSVSLNMQKSYSSLKQFPKQLSVRITSESDGGSSDSTVVFYLRESKDTRAPIRVH